jgi:hypothetical protein
VPDGNALVWRDAMDLTATAEGDLGSRVLAVINTATILRSGLPNPRAFYLPINPINTASLAFARESGAEHVPGLDVLVGAVVHQCHVIDHGPGGILGSLRATIHAELGLPAPAAADAPSRDGHGGSARRAVTEADVRQALRDLDRPSELARSPLVALTGGPEPAAGVRALLERAITEAFGAGHEEELLRAVVAGAYAERRSSHEDVAHALHVSRATYFRRLRQATVRVCDYVLASAAR